MVTLLGLCMCSDLSLVYAESDFRNYNYEGYGPVSERRPGTHEFTFNVTTVFTEVRSAQLSIYAGCVSKGETQASFNGISLGELKEGGDDFFDLPTTTVFNIPPEAILSHTSHKLVVQIEDNHGTLAWILTSPMLIINGRTGITLQASDGEVEDGVLVKWTAPGSAKVKSYELYRTSREDGISEHIGTFSATFYFDQKAKPDVKYLYKVLAVIETDGNTEPIMVRLLHRLNNHILKKYVKTLDFDLLCIIPFRFRKN